ERREIRDWLLRIATEGRKYGLFLLVLSQRPARLHPTLLTQCRNLCLMKMSNRADVATVERIFGLRDGVADRALQFGVGDALLAGNFVGLPLSAPRFAHSGPRRTVQGGRNIGDHWLSPP